MAAEILITSQNEGKTFKPIVTDPITWTTERKGAPGKLKFSVVKDDTISFHEGDAVSLYIDGRGVFFGFVFSKRRDREQIIEVTAYDQLRYFQNKDTYVYEGKTAAELIGMIARDFNLKTGELEDTGYVIASRVEDNTSLFDIVGNALDMTLENTGALYVLYDDFGQLVLRSLENMRVKNGENAFFMIDAGTGENFDYTSSIDTDTYDRIKLLYENEDTGKREVYIAQDGANMNRWGVLQYTDTLSKGENGQAKADALLKLYNKRTRTLKIANAFGDVRVRGGSIIAVALDLGDVELKSFMLVEKAVHTFGSDEHFMELKLRGGEFVG